MIERAVLWFCAPESDAETILGDLFEENRGAWWRAQQALRSAGPLLSMRWRSGELGEAVLASILGIAIPLRLADLFWAFIHSQVPLKADTSWSAAVWLSNLAVACTGAVIASRVLGAHTARAFALFSLAGSASSICFAIGRAPWWYILALAITVPAIALCASQFRHRRGSV